MSRHGNSIDDLKERINTTIVAAAGDLVSLSRLIYGNPELAFEERLAAAAVADVCAGHGLNGGAGAFGLETAVHAAHGDGDLNLAFCAEYDALPGMGHACGHNLIASAAVGAAIGLAAVANELDVTVTLLGTPAEERGGGKVEMLTRGAFTDVHAAFMAHPGPTAGDLASPSTLAIAQFEVAYTGRSSHASVAPHLGINAADAMTVAQVAIGLLRQQLAPGQQVHGVVTSAGSAANVIPAEAGGEFFVRDESISGVTGLRARVLACFDAGATATGCACAVTPIGEPYAELQSDPELTALYQANAEAHGRQFEPPPPPIASTDMGNVSQVIPSIHPIFGLDSFPAVPHQPQFADYVSTDEAHRAMVSVAMAMAGTAADAAFDEALRARLLEQAS